MTKAGFGEHLKREREMRGVSLDEICAATRIGTRFLEALENEEWNRLPGGVFNRGFVRAVARFLGLDEDGLVAEYALAMSEHTGAPASMWTSQPHHQQLAGHWPANPGANWPLRIGVLIAVLFLAGAGWLGWRRYGSPRTEQVAQDSAQQTVSSSDPAGPANWADGPSATSATSPAPPAADPAPRTAGIAGAHAASPSAATAPGATSSGATPSAATATSPALPVVPSGGSAVGTHGTSPAAPAAEISGLQLKIAASKPTSVTVAADGRQVFRATIAAGQSRTFSAHNRIAVRAQDAGAVSLELNGQPVPAMGRAGHSARIALTRRDLKAAGGPD